MYLADTYDGDDDHADTQAEEEGDAEFLTSADLDFPDEIRRDGKDH